MKTCSECGILKKFDDFHKHNREIDGLYYICKECRKIKSKNDYHNNKIKDKIIITGKTCSSCLIDKDINLFHKQIGSKDGYRFICKECRSSKFKNDYQNYPEFSSTHKKRTKEYTIKNREKVNDYFKLRYIKKPHEYAWRGMIRSVIRRFGGKKESSTYEILGYSAEELKEHLETLFANGMSWENWGEWHIDHIIPISKFDKNSDPKVVNALSNLQPLWGRENIIKGNRV